MGACWSCPIRVRRSARGDTAWTALPERQFSVGGGRLLALPDGGALLIGGSPSTFANNPFSPTQQILRFMPTTATWTKQHDMPDGRSAHTLTALPDGTILVVGGDVPGLSPRQPTLTLDKVGRYDPATDRWSPVAPLVQARFGHTATLLPDGRVLVVGGSVSKTVNSENAGSDARNSAEIYSPVGNIWQLVAPMGHARSGQSAVLLPDGTVLVIGGDGGAGAATAERYDPRANTWTSAGDLGASRSGFAVTPLLDGDVLVTGGTDAARQPLATATRYVAATKSWQSFPALPTPRTGHAAVLTNGAALLIGGDGTGAGTSAVRYDATPDGTTCSGETGHCVGGAFLDYWQAHGGLTINGYPLSNPFPEQLEDGKVYLVQYFERVRMEYHPENAAPYDVLLGQFGRQVHPADPPVAQEPGGLYFAQTGHNLTGGFAAYWVAKGGLAQFGYPITETITETLEDGKEYRVQYFERARLEYHPENAAPYDVLLGQFGRKILAGR